MSGRSARAGRVCNDELVVDSGALVVDSAAAAAHTREESLSAKHPTDWASAQRLVHKQETALLGMLLPRT